MKNSFNRGINEMQKNPTFFNETVLLAGLTLLIFGYIIFSFLYPLFAKGLLF